jgi:hypothetical protein
MHLLFFKVIVIRVLDYEFVFDTNVIQCWHTKMGETTTASTATQNTNHREDAMEQNLNFSRINGLSLTNC